ncbi:hypothetical protein NEDG_00003 [Nematocida displodere]|uniref:Uncharacterized protein n=1 Tax=Nematocida displodere TaxID=1805483 RepID=A0A177EI23_9MICR|nr:hypothetical protein NEDG_00003 [Nematocida displodere]
MWKQLSAAKIVFLVLLPCIAYCAEALAPIPPLPHIVSPYIKQTIKFFGRCRSSSFPNRLETIQAGEEVHLLKRQAQPMAIALHKLTLRSVPEKLVPGIEFSSLLIKAATRSTYRPFRPAVMDKILRAFGTICANRLELWNIDTNGSIRGVNIIQTLTQVLSPRLEPELTRTKCVLSIRSFRIFGNDLPVIRWFQNQVDMSSCQINLMIRGPFSLDNRVSSGLTLRLL